MKTSKENFLKFIKNYQNKLIVDVFYANDPPLITYNDFSLGKWPESIVASTYLYSDDPNDLFYCPEEERTYMIEV